VLMIGRPLHQGSALRKADSDSFAVHLLVDHPLIRAPAIAPPAIRRATRLKRQPTEVVEPVS
jgi:hypothetical protein